MERTIWPRADSSESISSIRGLRRAWSCMRVLIEPFSTNSESLDCESEGDWNLGSLILCP